MVQRLKGAIDKFDPLGLRALGAPADEYEPQARAIAADIDNCRTLDGCVEVIWRVFDRAFDDSAGEKHDYVDMAREINEIAKGLTD